MPAVQSVFRVKNKTAKTNDGQIIVKLMSTYERTAIMRSISTFRRQRGTFIRLHHIGMESSAAIYVNENLTASNSAIMRAASKFKKENKLAAAYSFRGLVYLKLDGSGSPTLLTSLAMLDETLTSNIIIFRE